MRNGHGVVDLLNSERGTLCVLLVIAATVLVVAGKLTVDDWMSYTKWIATVLVASKTVTSAVYAMKENKDPEIPTATATETAKS